MSKHQVFLLHGMGHHAEGWEAPYVAAIKLAYGQFPDLAARDIEQRVDFVTIHYDHIFREVLDAWANNAEIIAAASAQTGVPLSKLTKWLAGAGELKDNFAWTHAADVLLYRAFSLVRNRVCTHVARQIVDRLQAESAGGPVAWSAIGHSLGTAVLHDTLARLWNPHSQLPGAEAFAAHNAQAHLLMMVANVSRVLEVKTAAEPYDVFDTAVKPGFAGQSGRGCRYYLNARHRLDPFTVPKMFSPQMWPDEAALTARPPRYLSVEVDHIHQENVHDFAHYLLHPAVYVPMLRRLFGMQAVSDDDERDALARFRAFGPLQDQVAIELKTRLENILPSQAADWLELGKLRRAFDKLAKV
ncbi:MAG: hypothetical protein Q7U73_20905 [Rubrivivax sp.]|nr:hypothetical protein [Rubrivivax sp.]